MSKAAVFEPPAGLSDHEIVALVTVAKSGDVPGGEVSAHLVKHDCQRASYTDIAVTLALGSLLRRGFVETGTGHNERGDPYPVYRATERGLDWLKSNKDRLILRRRPKEAGQDDVPF